MADATRPQLGQDGWRRVLARLGIPLRPATGRLQPLTLARRIGLHQAVVALMLLASAGATWVAVERIDYLLDRDRLAGRQVDALVRLSAQMNRYSENIAELLLLGRTELDDFDEARTAVDAGLFELGRLTERELALLRDPSEAREEQAEADRVLAMRSLFERIDLSAQRLLLLRDEGRVEEATALFRGGIEEGLDAELEVILAQALEDEEAELRALEERTNRLEARLVALAVLVAAAALLVSSLAGIALARSLAAPLGRMASATRALAEGDLAARIDGTMPGELADLARQFNRAVSELAAERDRLLAVQGGLEAEVARRTADLEEANARLQRLDHMRMLFLADIGHELRTPLTILRGEAEVALRPRAGPEDRREALERVAGVARSMGRLVEDLLFLARAEVGAVRFDMEPLDLGQVAEAALSEARVLADARGLAFEARLAPVPVEGDAGRLGQALLIVLDNAVKYADAGSAVRVALAREGGEAVLRVANRGPAIPAADLPFLFSRFYRGHGEAARRVDGAGLGLPIAKWILDSHGGAIAVESAGGVTTATLRLPVRR